MTEIYPEPPPESGNTEGLSRMIDLEAADMTVLGWEHVVLETLRDMRRELPYAERLTLDLRWVAR